MKTQKACVVIPLKLIKVNHKLLESLWRRMFVPFQRLESGIRMYGDVDSLHYLPYSNFREVNLKPSCKG